MKYIVIILLLFLVSCGEDITRAPKMELRQLAKQDTSVKNSSGSMFFLIGSYNSSETTVTTVKVFAKTEKGYRFISMPIENIIINIDNRLTKPQVQIEYYGHGHTNDSLIEADWKPKTYIISCPEIYLPEKLLPINL